MYPFSFIIILFCIVNIVKNRPRQAFLNQLTFTIFISVFIEVGYFLDSNVIRIEYWQISSILTFITAIALLPKHLLINKHFSFYILTLLINVFILIIFPLHKRVVVGSGGVFEAVISGRYPYLEPSFSKFTIFFLSLSIIQAISIQVAFKLFNINDYYFLIHKMSLGIKIIIIIVLAEFVLRRFGFDNVYSNFLIEIFGKGPSTLSINELRGSSFYLQGLTREGSHLVYSLFTGLIILYVESRTSYNNTQTKLFIILCIITILLSMAFTSFLIFVMLILMYYIYHYYDFIKKRDIFRIIGLIGFIIFISIISLIILFLLNFKDTYYYERALSSYQDVLNLIALQGKYIPDKIIILSSTTTRILNIFDNLSLLSYRPFFGVGLGTNFSYGSTALTLAETGILGLISYVYFYFFSIPINNKKNIYKILIFIWIVGNLFVSSPTLLVRMDSYLFFVCLYLLINNDFYLNTKPLLKK